MRVRTPSGSRNFKTVWMEGSSICMIDQRKLPAKFEIFRSKNTADTARAIKNMTIRGAPAIGAVASYGMAQAALKFSGEGFERFLIHIKKTKELLSNTRPTAYDLFHALEEMTAKIEKAETVSKANKLAVSESRAYAKRSEEACKRIGITGEKLIKNKCKILTHCNAGALGCVDHGTALAPMRFAKKNKKNIFVWVDETRPRLQGAKLTSWELANEGIPHAIIADNAAGHFMRKGEVDMVIVGADRIAMNGDVANKIGTYEKAVLSKENGIPFYVAAPLTTFDPSCRTGDDIKIEERESKEVLFCGKERISPKCADARNPGFDVTPARYVSGIITERGIIKKPREISGRL